MVPSTVSRRRSACPLGRAVSSTRCVINTHLHFEHCGQNAAFKGNLTSAVIGSCLSYFDRRGAQIRRTAYVRQAACLAALAGLGRSSAARSTRSSGRARPAGKDHLVSLALLSEARSHRSAGFPARLKRAGSSSIPVPAEAQRPAGLGDAGFGAGGMVASLDRLPHGRSVSTCRGAVDPAAGYLRSK